MLQPTPASRRRATRNSETAAAAASRASLPSTPLHSGNGDSIGKGSDAGERRRPGELPSFLDVDFPNPIPPTLPRRATRSSTLEPPVADPFTTPLPGLSPRPNATSQVDPFDAFATLALQVGRSSLYSADTDVRSPLDTTFRTRDRLEGLQGGARVKAVVASERQKLRDWRNKDQRTFARLEPLMKFVIHRVDAAHKPLVLHTGEIYDLNTADLSVAEALPGFKKLRRRGPEEETLSQDALKEIPEGQSVYLLLPHPTGTTGVLEEKALIGLLEPIRFSPPNFFACLRYRRLDETS